MMRMIGGSTRCVREARRPLRQANRDDIMHKHHQQLQALHASLPRKSLQSSSPLIKNHAALSWPFHVPSQGSSCHAPTS